MALSVAPYVGAWIETTCLLNTLNITESHPMWVRGLKRGSIGKVTFRMRSHPMWVRGLKPTSQYLHIGYASRTLCGCVD